MKELAVLSGKGGTGKTTVMAALSRLAQGAVLADCDVDAPNLHLFISGDTVKEHGFTASRVATLDASRCTRCGLCAEACRFDAIRLDGPSIDRLSCEGCDLCARLCPVEAIAMNDRTSGRWAMTRTADGMMFHARLEPGEGNSGKLVTLLKRRAREHALETSAALLLVDGPPGTGCPAIAALSGADAALLIAEPSRSGKADIERILALCRRMNVPPVMAINRWDLHPGMAEELEELAREEKVPMLGRIPFDEGVHRCAASGRVVDAGPAGRAIGELWTSLQGFLRD